MSLGDRAGLQVTLARVRVAAVSARTSADGDWHHEHVPEGNDTVNWSRCRRL
jgi:hypothetical protein